jgi:hypothetical protein
MPISIYSTSEVDIGLAPFNHEREGPASRLEP